MNIVASVLLLAIAIALGIALAPFILSVVGWGLGALAAVALLVAAVWCSGLVLRYGVNALNEGITQFRSAVAYHFDLSTTAWQMAFVGKRSHESSTLLRRLQGLGILCIYAALGVVVIPFLLVLLHPILGAF